MGILVSSTLDSLTFYSDALLDPFLIGLYSMFDIEKKKKRVNKIRRKLIREKNVGKAP